MARKTKRSTAFTILAVVILLVVVFGKPLGLFSIGQRTSTSLSGSWEDWSQGHDYADYPIPDFESATCARTTSTATISFVVPDPLVNHTGDIGEYDVYYNSIDVNNNPPYLTISCGGNELFEDSSFRTEPNNISVSIPSSCVFFDNINDNYKIRMHISTKATCIRDERVNYWECIDDQTKCIGKNYLTCEGNFFLNRGLTLGECGVECIEPEKCEGEIYSTCENNLWDEQGQIDGKCGYTSPVDCTSGQEKCEGSIFYECSNSNWASQGQVDGKCGFSDSDGSENGVPGESENSLNEVIFTVGDFQIKLWMLLLLIAAIVILLIIK